LKKAGLLLAYILAFSRLFNDTDEYLALIEEGSDLNTSDLRFEWKDERELYLTIICCRGGNETIPFVS
jgi:hypothetical protein